MCRKYTLPDLKWKGLRRKRGGIRQALSPEGTEGAVHCPKPPHFHH